MKNYDAQLEAAAEKYKKLLLTQLERNERITAEGDFIDGRVAVLRSGKKNHFLLRLS